LRLGRLVAARLLGFPEPVLELEWEVFVASDERAELAAEAFVYGFPLVFDLQRRAFHASADASADLVGCTRSPLPHEASQRPILSPKPVPRTHGLAPGRRESA
jgi:hypothetical protein